MAKDPKLAAQVRDLDKTRQAMVGILGSMKERKKLLERQRGNRSAMSDQEVRKLDSDIRMLGREYDKKSGDLKVVERSISDLKRLLK